MAGYGGAIYNPQRSPDRAGYGGPQIVRSVPQRITSGITSRGVHGGLSWKPWTPPPIPSNYFNPVRSAELGSQKVTGENVAENLGKQRTATENDYALGRENLEHGLSHLLEENARTEGQDTAKRNEALATIARSFSNLKSQQEQNANTAGVFSGGALLQAATKRAANEGIQTTAENANYNRAIANIKQADLNAENAEKEGLGKEGLTRQQQLAELEGKELQQGRNAAQEALNTHLLMDQEAAGAGYRAPTNPNGREYHGGPEGVYRVIRRGNEWLSVTPRGRVFQRRRV
jgi:hypothetical protein